MPYKQGMRNQHFLWAFVVFWGVFLIPLQLYAENPARDIAAVETGVGQTVNGAFAIPVRVLQGAAQSFPFGIITGAIQGTFETVGWVVNGAANVARGAAPYAKYAAFI